MLEGLAGSPALSAQFLVTIGGILLLGLLTSAIGRHTFLPRVTLLLLFGMAVGQYSLQLIPAFLVDNFPLVADITLVMVGFLLGGKLRPRSFAVRPLEVVAISLIAAVMPALLVTVGLTLVGTPAPLSLLLGTIAAATAPAAILDVVKESGHKGPFTGLLLSIVAVDDVWGLVLFSIALALVGPTAGEPLVYRVLSEVGGAVVIGVALGLPAAWLTGRIRTGQPMLSEALGLVFLCGGLALWFGTSLLIAPIVMGAVIANLARHHAFAFHQIEHIEWSVLVLFFVLAGATLELPALAGIGSMGVLYVVLRSVGKLSGAWLGAGIAASPVATRHWMGMALLPHAGVAIGMALVASHYFPEYHDTLLPVVISATVVFEIFGPVCARLAIKRASAEH